MMKKRCIRIFVIVASLVWGLSSDWFSYPVIGQTKPGHLPDTRMEWWRDARFGMFIHWGLYAIPAGEWNGKTIYGEWIRHSAQIPLEQYDTFLHAFNPGQFNAREWVSMAREAGMKYLVITTKHHDGFCLFDTDETTFNIMETPFGRDVMKELAEACREEGIRLCFYYSIMDWHHPDYLPRRTWETGREDEKARFDRYVRYMKHQLKELLTQYGDIGVLWFDGEWESTWNGTYGKEIYAWVRKLQPGIIINNRVGAGRLDMEGLTREGAFGGDFGTPEQQIPPSGLPGTDWETCMTMNDHWGYNRTDTNYKSATEIISMLSDIASKGGNFLLNVGPDARGLFPPEAIDRLKQIGDWMKVNGEAIYGTQASPFDTLSWGRCTMKTGNNGEIIFYLHLFSCPANGEILLPGCLNEPLHACLLAAPGDSLETGRIEDALLIKLPDPASLPGNPVVKLMVRGPLDITYPPLIVADNDLFIDRMKVELVSDRPNVEIRFTGDGSIPTENANLYTEPLEVRGVVTINARCFRDGKPVSGTASRTMSMVIPMAPKAVNDPKPGLRYRVFEGEWDRMPDFDTLPPVSWGKTGRITLEMAKQQDRFGIRFTGFIKVPEKEVYTFYTESDDGSLLYIGSKKVVDNDGLHGLREAQGSIGLAKGFHPITITYFEQTGSQELKVYVKSPFMEKQPLPAEWLFH